MRRPLRHRRLASSSKPIVKDIWGEEWQLFERRPTPYGFPLLMGRPYPPQSVRGGSGGTGVIMTAPLAAHLRANARRPYEKPLPVGHGAIIRLRESLGIGHREWDDARIQWWVDRIDDLATLPVPEFVAKHGDHPWTRSGTISEALVWNMRVALVGRHNRPLDWWKTPAMQKFLMSDLRMAEIAERLSLSTVRIVELRAKIRRMRGIPVRKRKGQQGGRPATKRGTSQRRK